MLRNSNNNENNAATTQPACAACKHQRKRCKTECILAPYFPADKSKEFQAVHKVFGVSNLGKLMSCVKEVDRKKASESFMWEANCRLQDPALGPQGEYLKVCEELKKYKKLCEDLSRTVQFHNTTTTPPGVIIGWNGTNGMGNGIVNSTNNAFSYNNDTGNNLMVDLSSCGFHSHYVQNPDKVQKQQTDVGPIVVPYQQQQQQNSLNTGYHQQYYLPAGQYGSVNVKTVDGTIWEDQS